MLAVSIRCAGGLDRKWLENEIVAVSDLRQIRVSGVVPYRRADQGMHRKPRIGLVLGNRQFDVRNNPGFSFTQPDRSLCQVHRIGHQSPFGLGDKVWVLDQRCNVSNNLTASWTRSIIS